MEPAEQARLLLERASHRLSGGEIAVLERVAEGAAEPSKAGDDQSDAATFRRVSTEFAAYLQF